MKKFTPLQYITHPKQNKSITQQVEMACKGGVRWIQLRMKEYSKEEIIEIGKASKPICKNYNAIFIINAHVDIALELDADGVHVGKEDTSPIEARKILGESKIIGATCNTFEDVLLRAEQKVDYIGLGPYTYTHTKEKLSPVLGLEGYKTILDKMKKADIRLPIYAIGGITEKDIPLLMYTGIYGIAVSGMINNAENPEEKAKKIINSFFI
ncbi:MAG: thiamine phosphate synthase [Odoribacter sp.]|nr:thiamine phosphate synthase [Odoribacter sp.]